MKFTIRYESANAIRDVEIDTDAIYLAATNPKVILRMQTISPLEFALGKNAPCNCKCKKAKKRG